MNEFPAKRKSPRKVAVPALERTQLTSKKIKTRLLEFVHPLRWAVATAVVSPAGGLRVCPDGWSVDSCSFRGGDFLDTG